MTAPTTPTEPSETLNERQWTLLERIVTKDSFLLSKMSDLEEADAYALLNEGLIDYDFDESRFVSDRSSREALAAHVAVAAPVPPERADDVIGEIVSALEASITNAEAAKERYGSGNGSSLSNHNAGRLHGEEAALKRTLQIVRDIAGR